MCSLTKVLARQQTSARVLASSAAVLPSPFQAPANLWPGGPGPASQQPGPSSQPGSNGASAAGALQYDGIWGNGQNAQHAQHLSPSNRNSANGARHCCGRAATATLVDNIMVALAALAAALPSLLAVSCPHTPCQVWLYL